MGKKLKQCRKDRYNLEHQVFNQQRELTACLESCKTVGVRVTAALASAPGLQDPDAKHASLVLGNVEQMELAMRELRTLMAGGPDGVNWHAARHAANSLKQRAVVLQAQLMEAEKEKAGDIGWLGY